MQVLKAQVKSRIMQAAKKEFLNRGYTQASMRVVAEQSEITVGNIYRYFSSKQALFKEIVSPAFESIQRLLESVEIQEPLPLPPDQYVVFREQFVAEVANAIQTYRDELVILLNGAEGTDYASAVKTVTAMIESTLDRSALTALNNGTPEMNLGSLKRLISRGLVEAVNDLILRTECYEDGAVKGELRMMIDFYFRDLVSRFT